MLQQLPKRADLAEARGEEYNIEIMTIVLTRGLRDNILLCTVVGHTK